MKREGMIVVLSLVLVLVLALGLSASAMGMGFWGWGDNAPDLNDEERAELRELDQEMYQLLVPLQEEMRDLTFELRQEYLSDEPDEARIEELRGEIEQLRDEMAAIRGLYREQTGDDEAYRNNSRGPGRGGWGGFGWGHGWCHNF